MTYNMIFIFYTGQRIQKADLQASLSWLRKEKVLTYICGPSHMIEDMEQSLLQLNVDKASINYEKWW